ncbi:hypothetical protein SPF06_01145 [Sinomonas sp. JGH33]|uniref:Holin n=1 Tax=Sinomonas terricola TaxID=3110330 RepID=A0ABU5T0Y4_9MICC|nr:hypothetical protein [Sinomonas sp. JGH33]MEA5453317.1 hypothetical protein [Sinomonas sp. JGH33]
MKKILVYAKSIAALVGSVVTALLAVLPPDQYKWLTIVGVVATTVATWAVPNAVLDSVSAEAVPPAPAK